MNEILSTWANQCGLAHVPLFEAGETEFVDQHCVLLNGGYGSFALSLASTPSPWPESTRWAWSSNLPHHVTVSKDDVSVIRWDKGDAEIFTRSTVERDLSRFHKFLESDRVESTQHVVNFMRGMFRRVRSLVTDAGMSDEQSTDAFLAFVSRAIERWRDAHSVAESTLTTWPQGEDFLSSLSTSAVEALLQEIESPGWFGINTEFVPNLAIRHAGSEIFQEAHFELLRAPQPDLFGFVAPADSTKVTRGGAHFTPPALARSLVEQTLSQIRDLTSRDNLVIEDPACGSGAFLHESLRTLRRLGFSGHVTLVGRDLSSAAVSMAKFVLENSVLDWEPRGGMLIDVARGDSLTDSLPQADVMLMNPPFVSWAGLPQEQRETMRKVLGKSLRGRGDLSMAFVSRAAGVLRKGGVLGTLLPGSLLTLEACDRWRREILERFDVDLVASLGEFGLFRYAHVQVAMLVLKRPDSDLERSERVYGLLADNRAEATSNALRGLRKSRRTVAGSQGEGWHLFATTRRRLREKGTWRLTPPSIEHAVARLRESSRVVAIGDRFQVRQGIRTGMNSVFMLTRTQLDELPRTERRWFHPAVTNQSIQSGKFEPGRFVFYPYDDSGSAIPDEDTLRRLVPTYFRQCLEPTRSRLEGRASIRRSARSDWWGLSERRSWALDARPKIVSKYFGAAGSFATDLEGGLHVVQGYAWFLRFDESLTSLTNIDEEAMVFTERDALLAYSAIMNSHAFVRVLGLYSAHVAGGQFDMSPRYVNDVPVPDIFCLADDETIGDVLRRIVEFQKGFGSRSDDAQLADQLCQVIYGDEILPRG